MPTFTDFFPTLLTVNRKFLITDFRLLSTSVKPKNFIDFYRSQKKWNTPGAYQIVFDQKLWNQIIRHRTPFKRRHDTQHEDTQHNDIQHNGRSLLCWVPFMLSVTYKAFMLCVIMQNVVMLSVIMLTVVGLRLQQPTCCQFPKHFTLITYGPCKVSYVIHWMHAPMHCFQNVPAYFATWTNFR